MGPSKHYRMSPSQMKRILACPFSAQENLPQLVSVEDKSGGKAATAGNAIHSMAGEVLAGERKITDVPYEWIEGVSLYVDTVDQYEGQRVVERCWESIAIDDFGGTTDCVILNGHICIVPDFKTGKWDVQAEYNEQLLSYSALVAEHHDVSEFWGIIVQPKVIRGRKVKVAKYTAAQVNEHRIRVAEAAVSDDKGTGDHCRFCPLRLNRSCAEGNEYCKVMGWK